jgi:hypothetical protein
VAPRRAPPRPRSWDTRRFTPTEIAELPAGRALIQITDRRTA